MGRVGVYLGVVQLSSAPLSSVGPGQGWPLFLSKFTPLQMCAGSSVAASYSKSAAEGSSICGVERCGVVSPSHWHQRKFVLPRSQEALEEGGRGEAGGKGGCGGATWGWIFGTEESKLESV